MILYYLERDLLLDLTGTFNMSVAGRNLNTILTINSNIDLFGIGLEESKYLGDLFIVNEDPNFSRRFIRSRCLEFSKSDSGYVIRITGEFLIIGKFLELEHIYRDRKISLIL
jgi:hypothetical protein